MLKTPDGKIVGPVRYVTVIQGEEPGSYQRGYDEARSVWASYWAQTGTHREIPEDLTALPARMFYKRSDLATIKLHDGVTSIGAEAFHSCSGLTSINLPDGITEIGQYAFFDCDLLGDITLPSSLTAIHSAIFAGCAGVKVRHIPNGVTVIEAYAFDGCTANNTAVVPASVEKVDNGAFRNNRGITEITFMGIPKITNTADRLPFASCINLKKMNLPWKEGQVAGAPWGAPSDCEIVYEWQKKISGVYTFPTGLCEIPNGICKGNTTLTEVTLGDEVTHIEDYAFNECTNLEKVNLPAGLKFIGAYAFYKCSKLKITELPDTVYEIESGSLAEIAEISKLPASIMKLETYCMDGCTGNTFTVIPASCISISAFALRNNDGLTSLTFEGKPEKGIAANAFGGFVEDKETGELKYNGCDNLTDIYVPWAEGEVAGEFDEDGNRINWGAAYATVHHLV